MLDPLIQTQREKLFKLARELVPNITQDDILQPNDFPVLENHPLFRYEEGLLHGLMAAQSVLNSIHK